MLKPPPPTKKPQAKAKSQPKAQSSDDDKDSELHKYAAPGEHIEIPSWKRSGLVGAVENAHYGPDAARRYLVHHNPSDEKGTWYHLEPHHFVNNDNPDHAALAKEHADTQAKDLRERAKREKDPEERQAYLSQASEYERRSGGGKRDTEKASGKRELPPPPPLKPRK